MHDIPRFTCRPEKVEAALAEGRWAGYVFLHERAWRFDALQAVIARGADRDPGFWELVADVWSESGNIHENLEGWKAVWRRLGSQSDRLAPMTAAEREDLAALPDEIAVWRGVTDKAFVAGLSWTTDQAKAEWFAHRFAMLEGQAPFLASGTVRKADLVAYFTRHGEGEAVVFPEAVAGVQVVRLRARRKARTSAAKPWTP